MKHKTFVPPNRPERAPYEMLYLDDCLKYPGCPTGYLAKGWMEMNTDLKLAWQKIEDLQKKNAKLTAKCDSIVRQSRKLIKERKPT